MENEDSRTVWCGNLSDNITEELLYELFLQAAPIERIRIPQDRGGHKANYAFITLKHAQSVQYVVQLLGGISLFDKRLNIKPRCKNQINEFVFQPNVKDRLGNRCYETPRNDVIAPLLPCQGNIGNLYFQNLFEMGPMMNAVNMQHTYASSLDNRLSDDRDTRIIRDYRRQGHKPYGRNDRYGQSRDRNYEQNPKHRRF